MSKELANVSCELEPKTIFDVQKFQARLNEKPDKKKIKINKEAKNSKYIPVDGIETLLDQIYCGLWKTSNFTYQVIANEIVGSITLEVFHPEARTWLSRLGAGAVMIQLAKGADITDISKKYTNTLVKDFPHLKSECIKNAAKSLGKAFGRSLNRDDDKTFEVETEYSDMSLLTELNNDIKSMSFTTMKTDAVIIAKKSERLSKQDATEIKLNIQAKINSLRKENNV